MTSAIDMVRFSRWLQETLATPLAPLAQLLQSALAVPRLGKLLGKHLESTEKKAPREGKSFGKFSRRTAC